MIRNSPLGWFPLAPEGYPIILPAALAAAVVALIPTPAAKGVAVCFLAFAAFAAFFFRDPDRSIPSEQGCLVSPADGKVIEASVVEANEFVAGKRLKISIFMSVFNVHVNRVPVQGTVTDIVYRPGKFFSANLDKASADNERSALFLKTEDGRQIVVVQIAGLIARRIVCRVKNNDQLGRGERFGVICFGSRVDLYLPSDTRLAIGVGDRVEAGASILGHLADFEG